jgi:ribonuclease-3
VYTTLPHILKNKLYKDFKTLLQEFTQAEYDITPCYKVLEDSGPDHDKNFHI